MKNKTPFDTIELRPAKLNNKIKRRTFKYRNREFWCKGYYVDTVGKNTAKIKEYIQNQIQEDKLGEQLRIDYPESPFN